MLTLLTLTAVLSIQQPPAPPVPPAPPAPPEPHARFMVMEGGPGGLDKDGDGQVSRDEFAAPMTDHFARLDANGDGRLSDEELSGGAGARGGHGMMVLRGGPEGGPGVHRFEMGRSHADGDAGPPDGAGETRTTIVVRRGEPGPGGEREIVIHGPGGPVGPHGMTWAGDDGAAPLDADNDGRLSEAEFTAPLREAFARMDADRSGFVEAGERGGDRAVRVFTHRLESRREGED